MQLKSMTAYARSELSTDVGELHAEIKCVNSRYCDVVLRLPKSVSFMEIPLKSLIAAQIVRGKAEVNIDIRLSKPAQAPSLNRAQFIAAYKVLEQMKTLGGIGEDIRLEHLLRFPDLIDISAQEDTAELELPVEQLVKSCLDALASMRSAEGANLAVELEQLLSKVESLCKTVAKGQTAVLSYWQKRFESRLQDFLSEPDMKARIVQEAAIYAQKVDIQEELARISSHCSQFRQIMANEFPAGKKLDFLCQELMREWNTIASKSSKTDIIQAVVEAKTFVESIREQVQNVI